LHQYYFVGAFEIDALPEIPSFATNDMVRD
jgi:hypothetical protein